MLIRNLFFHGLHFLYLLFLRLVFFLLHLLCWQLASPLLFLLFPFVSHAHPQFVFSWSPFSVSSVPSSRVLSAPPSVLATSVLATSVLVNSGPLEILYQILSLT